MMQALADSRPRRSRRLIQSAVLITLMLALVKSEPAQEAATAALAVSDFELLTSAEADIAILQRNWFNQSEFAHRAERKLKSILQRDPETPYLVQIQADLIPVHEILGKHNLATATFYMDRMDRGKGGIKSAESRLLQIAREYSTYSKMDEVLFRLSTVALKDERADDSTRYLGQLICDYPNSKYLPSVFARLDESSTAVWEGCGKFKP